METLLIVFIVLTTVNLIIHQIILTKLKKKVNENSDNQEIINQYIRTEINKIKIQIEDVHQLIRENEIAINSSTQSRFDKLTNQIIKSIDKVRSEIPPTNDELLKEIDQLKEVNRIRMNM